MSKLLLKTNTADQRGLLQADDLVCASSQMPTRTSNNGWHHAVRHNDECRDHVFTDKERNGVTHVRHQGNQSWNSQGMQLFFNKTSKGETEGTC